MSLVELGAGLCLLALACLIGCLSIAGVLAIISSSAEKRRIERERCIRCHRLYCSCRVDPVGGEQAGL